MYAVCQNGRCSQSYLIDDIKNGRSKSEFLNEIKLTKGYRCSKCGQVVVDTEGNAMISQNAMKQPFVTVQEQF